MRRVIGFLNPIRIIIIINSKFNGNMRQMTKSKGERRPGTVQWNNAQRTMEKKDGLSILQERVAGDSRPAATKSRFSGKKRAKSSQ